MGRASLAARRAFLVALRTTVDAGGGGALQLCDGVMPDEPETPPASSPLAIIALDEVSFALDPAAASISLVPAVGHAARSGVPTWARYVDGAGNGVYLCTAGAPGSGAEIIVTNGETPPSAQLWTGGEITATHTISEP